MSRPRLYDSGLEAHRPAIARPQQARQRGHPESQESEADPSHHSSEESVLEPADDHQPPAAVDTVDTTEFEMMLAVQPEVSVLYCEAMRAVASCHTNCLQILLVVSPPSFFSLVWVGVGIGVSGAPVQHEPKAQLHTTDDLQVSAQAVPDEAVVEPRDFPELGIAMAEPAPPSPQETTAEEC